MVTNNVLQRTFHIKRGGKSGTAFAIDREGKQYLVTARHVVNGITNGDLIEVLHEKQWKTVPVEVVGAGESDVDVIVLSCPTRLAPPHLLEASAVGLAYGQSVYFLGFPFGWDGGGEGINRDFPIPFVKAGIVSAIISENPSRLYIDGQVNKGFSGGPVVFVPPGRTQFQVAGIVSSDQRLREPIVDKQGDPIVNSDSQPFGFYRESTGFVVAMDIRHVTDLINLNPIGLDLSAN